jgi:hypothetical protein
MAKKRFHNLWTLPKYTSLYELSTWPEEDLKKLYEQCINGRSCYIMDADPYCAGYSTGAFFEEVYNEEGKLR